MTNSIALFSSSSCHGNTRKLLDCVAEKIDIDIVDLSEVDFSNYDYKHRNIDDEFLALMLRALEYDNIIVASPVYWYSVTPTMKAFIDRITDLLDIPGLLESGRRLRGKKGYVLCTSISDEVSTSFIDPFSETFGYLGMVYSGCLHANCTNGFKKEEQDKNIFEFINTFSDV